MLAIIKQFQQLGLLHLKDKASQIQLSAVPNIYPWAPEYLNDYFRGAGGTQVHQTRAAVANFHAEVQYQYE